MVVRLGEELDAAGLGQTLERLQDIWSVHAALVEEHTGKREGDAELRMIAQHGEEQRIRRQIALLGYLPKYRAVLLIIEVISRFTDIRDSEVSQTERLMNLEVETDGGWCVLGHVVRNG